MSDTIWIVSHEKLKTCSEAAAIYDAKCQVVESGSLRYIYEAALIGTVVQPEPVFQDLRPKPGPPPEQLPEQPPEKPWDAGERKLVESLFTPPRVETRG